MNIHDFLNDELYWTLMNNVEHKININERSFNQPFVVVDWTRFLMGRISLFWMIIGFRPMIREASNWSTGDHLEPIRWLGMYPTSWTLFERSLKLKKE